MDGRSGAPARYVAAGCCREIGRLWMNDWRTRFVPSRRNRYLKNAKRIPVRTPICPTQKTNIHLMSSALP